MSTLNLKIDIFRNNTAYFSLKYIMRGGVISTHNQKKITFCNHLNSCKVIIFPIFGSYDLMFNKRCIYLTVYYCCTQTVIVCGQKHTEQLTRNQCCLDPNIETWLGKFLHWLVYIIKSHNLLWSEMRM